MMPVFFEIIAVVFGAMVVRILIKQLFWPVVGLFLIGYFVIYINSPPQPEPVQIYSFNNHENYTK